MFKKGTLVTPELGNSALEFSYSKTVRKIDLRGNVFQTPKFRDFPGRSLCACIVEIRGRGDILLHLRLLSRLNEDNFKA